MFSLGFMFKNVKNGSFFVFSLNDSYKPVIGWTKYLVTFERSHLALSKCYGLLSSELPLARCQPLIIEDVGNFADSEVFLIFLPSVSHKR